MVAGASCSLNTCMVILLTATDCGAPFGASGVTIDPFNNTKFGALITFHSEESSNSMTAVCGSDGEWFPNPASLVCGESGNTPTVPDRNKPTWPIDVSSSGEPIGIFVIISVAALFLLILLTITISIVVAIKKKRR